MSLRSKIVLILVAVVGVYAFTTDRIQRGVFLGRFAFVEQREAVRDLRRVVEALHDEIDDVDRLSLKWSAWDDAYAFVSGERVEPFVQSNLEPVVLRRQGIDLLFFLTPDTAADDGSYGVLWSSITDPAGDGQLRLREFPRGNFHATHPVLVKAEWERERYRQELERGEGFLSQLDEEQRLARQRRQGQTRRPVGILLTEHAPLLVSARPIVDSRGEREPTGVLVLGRFLGDALRDELAAKTRVADLDFWQADGRHPLPPDAEAVLDRATASAEGVVEVADQRLLVWGTFPDFNNRPALLLRAAVDRDVTTTGAVAVQFGLVSALVGGLVLLLVLTFLLQRIVLAPISRLTSHAVEIGRTENFRAKLGMRRGDELGTLSREFDRMMEKLAQARSALVDTARTAGMSEIATGILHNVGNVLNSVNISASMVAQKVDGMSIEDLRRVAEVLEEHKSDLTTFIDSDPKGKHLQPFLSALSVQLGEERRHIADEVGSLAEGIEHICELIKSQQSYAVQAELVEEVAVAEKMDEALRITHQAASIDPDLEVVREYEDLPPVLVDKHRLLEILVNLIQNARQAMSDGDGPKRLTLRVRRRDERVQLQVEDTGKGIPTEDLTKVFNLGFTTKAEGHGYGLHTAANAAAEMGGTLGATSDGPGEGATFTLELPLRLAHVAEEAA